MVLNLLYSRTLEEARAFIDRSFNTYLSEYLVAMLAVAQNWPNVLSSIAWDPCAKQITLKHLMLA